MPRRLIRRRQPVADETGVLLTIDGLSLFTAAEKKGTKGELPFTHLIVKSGQENATLVKGWFVNENRSEEFLVNRYAESLAGSLNITSEIGTITATFHAAWPKGTKPPPDEPRGADQHSQGGDATSRGASFEQKYVPIEMEVGVLRAVIPVRYTR